MKQSNFDEIDDESPSVSPTVESRKLISGDSNRSVNSGLEQENPPSSLDEIQPLIPNQHEQKSEFEIGGVLDDEEEKEKKVRSEELCAIHASGLPCYQHENISPGHEHVHLPLCAAHQEGKKCDNIMDEEHRYNFLHVCPTIRKGDACRDGNFWLFFFLIILINFSSGMNDDFCISILLLLGSKEALFIR